MLAINKDVVNLILNRLERIYADPIEIHDFMATSKEIYELSREWRQQNWMLGSIMLKPYQVNFAQYSQSMTHYVHEEREIAMLKLIDDCSCDLFVFVLVNDFNKWKKLTHDVFGSNEIFVDELTEDSLDLFDTYSRIYVHEDPREVLSDIDLDERLDEYVIITDTKVKSREHVYQFVSKPERALSRTVLRKNWHKATAIIESRIMALDNFNEKLEEVILSANQTYILDYDWRNHPNFTKDHIKDICARNGYKMVKLSDPYQAGIKQVNTDKIVYYLLTNYQFHFDAGKCVYLFAPNFVMLNMYVEASAFITSYYEPREVRITRMYTDLSKTFQVVEKGFDSYGKYNLRTDLYKGYCIANMLNFDFFTLPDIEQYLLSMTITSNFKGEDLMARWKDSKKYWPYKNHKLSEDQVRALTSFY